MINPYTIEVIRVNWRDILGRDKHNGAICPLCGSGSGKHGSGLSLVPNNNALLKCFKCGSTGDVIRFVSKKFGWDDSDPDDFIKAVEYCANILGLNLNPDDHFNITATANDGYLKFADFSMSSDIKQLKPEHIDISHVNSNPIGTVNPNFDIDKAVADAYQNQLDRLHNARHLFGDENYDDPDDAAFFDKQAEQPPECLTIPDTVRADLADPNRNPFDHIMCTPYSFDQPDPDEVFDPALVAAFNQKFINWNHHIQDTDYWKQRGLSLETVNHFNCGFDPEWRHPKWQDSAPTSPRFIIPIGPVGYLARDVRKNLFGFNREKCKVKVGTMQVFNRDAFKYNCIFIVEGEIDAMSIFEMGFPNVCALGSIGYIDLFFSALNHDYVYGVIPSFPLAAIVALDNEDKPQVQRAKKEMISRLNSLGIVAIDGSSLSGKCKDPNDLLVADRAQLQERCQQLEDKALATKLDPSVEIVIPKTLKQEQLEQEAVELQNDPDYVYEDDNDYAHPNDDDDHDDDDHDDKGIRAEHDDPAHRAPAVADNSTVSPSTDRNNAVAKRKAEKFKKAVEREKKAAQKPGKAPATLVLSGTESTRKVLPACPVDLNIPENYKVSEDGIIEKGTIIAARNVIVPVAKIINHHTRGHKYEVAINDAAGNWDLLIVDALTLSDKSKIIELANRGLHIYAGDSAAATVRFLFEIIAMNEGNIPVREEFEQPGWSSDFFNFRMPWENSFYMPDLENIYTLNGNPKDWLDKAQLLSQNPISRLMIGTAFSAPILRIIGQRSFGVYLYGNSKAGKSAIQKFAISAFGNPNKIMGTFNATMNGIEALCTRSNDLPLLIDESTVAGRAIDEERLYYILSGEQSKIRMTRTLSQRPVKQWRLPLLMNGEGRMFDDATKEGAMNRTLEIALLPDEKLFPDEMSARNIHKFVEINHGKVGMAFLKALRQTAKEDAKDPAMSDGQFDFTFVNDVFAEIFDAAAKSFYPKYTYEQISLMATIATGYELFQSVFNNIPLDELADRAMDDIFNPNMDRLPNAIQLREDGRAWKIFIEYLQSRPNQFYGDHHYKQEKLTMNFAYPVLGEFRFQETCDVPFSDENDDNDPPDDEDDQPDLDEVLVLPTMAKNILADAGFSPNKLIRAFEQNGWISRHSVRWAGNKGKPQHMIIIDASFFTTNIEV